MFGRAKKPNRLTPGEYWELYRKLRSRWPEPFLEHAPSVQALVVMSVGVLDKHFNYNGGANWDEASDCEYLDVLRERLLDFDGFTPEEKEKIRWALSEILACGRELETVGESGRNAGGAIDILVHRVVDWVSAHPNEMKLGGDDTEYVGHF
jgi:hypothetical protein